MGRKTIDKYFLKENEKQGNFDEKHNRKLMVGVFDDMADHYCESIRRQISPCFVDEVGASNISAFEKNIDEILEDSESVSSKKIVSDLIGDLVIIDGTHNIEGKSAIDVRNMILRKLPHYNNRVLYLVGDDVVKYMDKYSQQFKELVNITHVVYTNKEQIIKDFILATAKHLGFDVESFDKEYEDSENTTELFVEKTKKYLSKLSDLTSILSSSFDKFGSFEKMQPSGFFEAYVLNQIKEHRYDDFVTNHSLMQYALSLSTKVKYRLKSFEYENVREKAIKKEYDPLKKFGEKVSKELIGNKDECFKVVVFGKDSEKATQLVQKNLFGVKAEFADYEQDDLEQFKSSNLVVFNVANKAEYEKAIKVKETLLESNAELEVKFVSNNKDFAKSADDIEDCDDLGKKVCNEVNSLAEENGIFVTPRNPKGEVRKEIADAIDEVISDSIRALDLIKELNQKSSELFKMGSISVSENDVLKIVENTYPFMLYYTHTASNVVASLRAIKSVMPKVENEDESTQNNQVESFGEKAILIDENSGDASKINDQSSASESGTESTEM